MKRRIIAIITITLTLCILTACGDSGKAIDITGTWSAEIDGTTLTYVFRTDGSGTADIGGVKFKAEYTLEENTLTIHLDGTEQIEEAFGMGVNEILAAGLITQGDLDAMCETVVATVDNGGKTLTFDGYVLNKVK